MRTSARVYAQVRVVPFVFPRAGPDGRRRGRNKEQLVEKLVSRRCGRARAYMRKFALCRLCFRELALTGDVAGVTKSSW